MVKKEEVISFIWQHVLLLVSLYVMTFGVAACVRRQLGSSVIIEVDEHSEEKADNELEELHPLEVSSENQNLQQHKDCVHHDSVAADSPSWDIVKNRSCRSHHVRDGGNNA